MSDYIPNSTIPMYVLRQLTEYGSTVISRKLVMKYKVVGIQRIFHDVGCDIKLEICAPLINSWKSTQRAKYPTEASYVLKKI